MEMFHVEQPRIFSNRAQLVSGIARKNLKIALKAQGVFHRPPLFSLPLTSVRTHAPTPYPSITFPRPTSYRAGRFPQLRRVLHSAIPYRQSAPSLYSYLPWARFSAL